MTARRPTTYTGPSGRVAQRESTPFTREGSQVQSLSRPPGKSNRYVRWADRLFHLAGPWIARGAFTLMPSGTEQSSAFRRFHMTWRSGDMARKVFGLVSAVAFLGGSATYGAPFGALSAWHEPSSQFEAGGLLADPVLAHWLRTLPQPDMELETGRAAATSGELFDQQPIGGEGSSWTAVTLPISSAQNFEPDVDRQLFDATPLGPKPGRFVSIGAQPVTVAGNSEPRPPLEGRSASRSDHARKDRALRAKEAARHRHRSVRRCTCTASAPTIAKAPVSN